MTYSSHQFRLPLLLTLTLLSGNSYAAGRGVPINYDDLSFVEEPLAVDIGGATLSGNFLADQAAQYNNRTDKDTYNTRVNGQAVLETQLSNSWRVGVQYLGTYNRLAKDEYTDNAAAFVADEWGMLAGGNVTGSVYEDTRRKRGVGNAALANDTFFGGLNKSGGYYKVRYNSFAASVTADGEGRAEAGLTFERPIGQSSYFVSARARKGHTSDGVISAGLGETYGAAVVGAYQYGSLRFDAQAGYENVDTRNGGNPHTFSSAGMSYKYGAYSVSAEGGVGEYNGNNLYAASLGGRMDVARGASLNLGVNYANPQQVDTTTFLSSIRYEF